SILQHLRIMYHIPRLTHHTSRITHHASRFTFHVSRSCRIIGLRMDVDRICIIGLGLMGGSLALALRPSTAHITVVETNLRTQVAARSLFDEVTADFGEGVRQAELVVLATP